MIVDGGMIRRLVWWFVGWLGGDWVMDGSNGQLRSNDVMT